jgi:large conductance mechanosensitive channel
MSIVKEFKEFALKGNVVDMAIGLVIGAAFGKIVSSLVGDILMPPLGFAMGGMDFADLKLTLKPGVDAGVDAVGAVIAVIPAVTINYGVFINNVISFVIVAFALFMVIKAMNKMKKKEEAKPAAVAVTPPDVELLTEIRDLLKKK